jgi:hypothetical protein
MHTLNIPELVPQVTPDVMKYTFSLLTFGLFRIATNSQKFFPELNM